MVVVRSGVGGVGGGGGIGGGVSGAPSRNGGNDTRNGRARAGLLPI